MAEVRAIEDGWARIIGNYGRREAIEKAQSLFRSGRYEMVEAIAGTYRVWSGQKVINRF